MQSPPTSQRSSSVRLSASIKGIIEEYTQSHQRSGEPDGEPFRLEVQTLHRFLELIEKVRSAEAHRSELEKAHLRDVEKLLHRCHRTLQTLYESLITVRDQVPGTNGLEEPWDFRGLTFTAPRAHISYYTRTLEMSLMSLNL